MTFMSRTASGISSCPSTGPDLIGRWERVPIVPRNRPIGWRLGLAGVACTACPRLGSPRCNPLRTELPGLTSWPWKVWTYWPSLKAPNGTGSRMLTRSYILTSPGFPTFLPSLIWFQDQCQNLLFQRIKVKPRKSRSNTNPLSPGNELPKSWNLNEISLPKFKKLIQEHIVNKMKSINVHLFYLTLILI